MSSPSSQGLLRSFLISILMLGCFGIILYLTISTTWLPKEVELKAPAPKTEKLKNFGSKNEQNPIILLMWIWPTGRPFGLDSCSALVNIDGCHLTGDRNMLNKSHGVIFHHPNIQSNISDLPPPQRPISQRWVWMNLESPTNSKRITHLNSLFNLTFNYRQDSDIPVRYATIVPTRKSHFTMPSKNKTVCWIVSNWWISRTHKRVAYYKALKEHVHINAYGRAFGGIRMSSQDFFPTISSCKFYLSFENSIHKDYITEKLYNPLYAGTVPIVLGPSRQNYENFVPGDAFIHVDDFPSPKELADHIRFLDKNDEMYRRYFEWRRHYEVKRASAFLIGSCLTCNYIRTHRNEYKVINNLNSWYWG